MPQGVQRDGGTNFFTAFATGKIGMTGLGAFPIGLLKEKYPSNWSIPSCSGLDCSGQFTFFPSSLDSELPACSGSGCLTTRSASLILFFHILP